MSQNASSKNFWTPPRIKAAQLVAEGKLIEDQIASEVGIARQTLTRWKAEPEFKTRVQEIIQQMADAIKAKGIRLKETRLAKLNAVTQKIEEVWASRTRRAALVLAETGQDSTESENTGGTPSSWNPLSQGLETGIVVIQHRRYGTEYAIDTPALKEYREYLKQAAIEVGEWTEKQEITGANGTPLFQEMADVLNQVYGSSTKDTE